MCQNSSTHFFGGSIMISTHKNLYARLTKSQKIPYYFALTILISFGLSACAPSDRLIKSTFDSKLAELDEIERPEEEIRIENFHVIRKVECEDISMTAKVDGIVEAWMVSIEFDSEIVGIYSDHVSKLYRLYKFDNGGWEISVNNDCP